MVAGDGGDQTHSVLRLLHLFRAPDVTAFDVKRVVERPLLGQTATVRVIGSSHCLSVPALDFHELCSCRPLPDLGIATVDETGDTRPDGRGPGGTTVDRTTVTVPATGVRRIPLSPGVTREVTSSAGAVRAETVVAGLALGAFPDGRQFDVRYRFGPNAVTAIATDGDSFETFHTYPEFGLTVRSVTELSHW